MELRTIFTFLRAAELRNFSKAADSLGYAQSTVTMQIQQLEEELGKPLFDRFNRSIALTAFGESFLPLARRMYSTAQEMHALSVDPAELTGTLRIGLVESLFFSDFLKLIPKYQALMPNVVLDFSTGSSVEIVDLLAHNKLDLGSYFAESSTTQELVPLFEHRANTIFVANPKHPLCQGGGGSAARLSQERFCDARGRRHLSPSAAAPVPDPRAESAGEHPPEEHPRHCGRAEIQRRAFVSAGVRRAARSAPRQPEGDRMICPRSPHRHGGRPS